MTMATALRVALCLAMKEPTTRNLTMTSSRIGSKRASWQLTLEGVTALAAATTPRETGLYTSYRTLNTATRPSLARVCPDVNPRYMSVHGLIKPHSQAVHPAHYHFDVDEGQ